MPTRTLPLHAHYSAPQWLPSDEVDALMRAGLSDVLAPRGGLDGRLYRPLGEREGCND
jgi:hypothetical protein